MFCPKCKSEYMEGITQCADCHIPLVYDLSSESESLPELQSEYANLVTFKTYINQAEAELAKGFLHSYGIKAIVSAAYFDNLRPIYKSSGGIRLLIKEEDVKDAEAIFKSAGL